MTSERILKLQRLLEAEPDDPFCLYALGQEYARAGAHEEAIGYFDRVLSVDPAHAYAYYHKARSLESIGRVAEARQVLGAALQSVRAESDPKGVSEIQEYLNALSS